MFGMKYKICAKEAISRWEEALPLGNGELGCLIWGSPANLRFSLDRVDVWDTTVPPGTESGEFTYANLVRLAREGNTEEIRRIFDAPYNAPVPTKLPVGKLILHIPQYTGVVSELALTDGQAVMRLRGERNAGAKPEKPGVNAGVEPEEPDVNAGVKPEEPGGSLGTAEVRSIVHAAMGVGLIRVGLPLSRLGVELAAPEFGREEAASRTYCPQERSISQGSLKQIVYKEPVRRRINRPGGGYLEYFQQETEGGFAYGVVLGVKAGEEETELCWRIVTTADEAGHVDEAGHMAGTEHADEARHVDGMEPWEKALTLVEQCLELGYDALLPSHQDWWEAYWQESGLSLPDREMERSWYISNYLLASCSRRGCYPMPLQGVWTADTQELPPWKGDYHNDLNTQMSYYHYLKANHLEQGVSFVDFLWDRREAGREFACRFYHTGGLCLPAVMTIDGKALGGWPMYSLSPTNQIWLCRAFDDYYRYTGEASFLKERAYPYFQETAECIGGLLTEGEDGLLYLPVSSSPEIHDDEAEAFLIPNSNYDLALLQYLYRTLEEYAGRLGAWEEQRKWADIRGRLPGFAVDGRGVLMLDRQECLRESHRHFSHAHAIHPLRLIEYDSPENRRIIDAVIRDLEELGTRMWVGFSFCWMAELYAVAKRGSEAAEMLRIFREYFCSPNGFHLNGDYKKKGYSSFDYRPFTLEANMCAADALQEMLLYSKEGLMEPFPAIPGEWREVSFQGLRAMGGCLVSASLKEGRLAGLRMESLVSQPVTICGWDPEGRREEGCRREIMLCKGENIIIP